MIDFNFRRVGLYMQLDIEINNVSQELGLLDEREANELRAELEIAIDEINRYFPKEEIEELESDMQEEEAMERSHERELRDRDMNDNSIYS